MVIKANFKVIGVEAPKEKKEQVKLTGTEEKKIKQNLDTFFASVKTLLREGAVMIVDSSESESEEETEEEKEKASFLNEPDIGEKPLTLHRLACSFLEKEKSDAILNAIQEVKMSEKYDLNLVLKENSKVSKESVEFLQKQISSNLKSYALELPAIMDERKTKLQCLLDARPDIKKYLENFKKNSES